MTSSRTTVVLAIVTLAVVATGAVLYLFLNRPAYVDAVHNTAFAPLSSATATSLPWRIEVRGPEVALTSVAVVIATVDGEYLLATRVREALFSAPIARERVARMFAVADGYRSSVEKPVSTAGADEVLILQESASLTVIVADSAGSPLADVGLAAGLFGQDASADWAQAVELGLGKSVARSLVTSRDGSATLPALLVGQRITVTAQSSSGTARGEIAVLPRQGSLHLVLTTAGPTVQVRCRTLDGEAAGAVALTYEMFGGTPDSPISLGCGALVSDQAGACNIHLDDASAVIVTGVESGWRFAARPEPLSAARPRIEVTLLREFSLQLKFEYEDGQPFLGGASVTTAIAVWTIEPAESAPGDWPGRGSIRMGTDGTVTVPRVAEGENIRVVAASTRDAFEGLYADIELQFADATNGRTLVLKRMAESRVPGRIRISGVTDNTASVQIVDLPWTNPRDSFTLAERTESKRLRPATYRVRVSGATVGWLSESVELAPGETRELVIPESRPGEVRATVVDGEGKPLPGATLIPMSRQHSRFPEEAVPYQVGVADKDGVVSLGGQPPGVHEYRIEAAGLQFRVERAVVTEGSVADLGRLVLAPAYGEIWVTVEGLRAAEEVLEVELGAPFGTMSTLLRVDLASDAHVFRALCIDRWWQGPLKLVQFDVESSGYFEGGFSHEEAAQP